MYWGNAHHLKRDHGFILLSDVNPEQLELLPVKKEIFSRAVRVSLYVKLRRDYGRFRPKVDV